MKKTILYLTFLSIGIAVTISSCTKEQQALNLLYGTWTVDSRTDGFGKPIITDTGKVVSTEEWTFYRCSDREDDKCTGTSKVTTVNSTVTPSTTTYDTDDFTYEVFQKSQLLKGGTVWNIDELKKKELRLSYGNNPKVTYTLSK